MTEIEILRKELEMAKSEIQDMRLQLANVTILLRKELISAGKLPKPTSESGDPI